MHKIRQGLFLLAIFGGCSCFAQNMNFPSIPNPHPASFPNQTITPNPLDIIKVPSTPEHFNLNGNPPTIEQQNQRLMQDAERQRMMQQQIMNEVQSDMASFRSHINYSLPSWATSSGTEYYYTAFDRIIASDSLYSLKDNVLMIENAYFDNGLDKADFDKIIDNCRAFLISMLKEKNYDLNSNLAKNYILFQFFSETLQLKNSKEKHLPFKYDFDDYMGINDYSKMFVSKLIQTGSGQCHSMPLLYLILAEEIGAEAYLSLSPNHSYIRFPDDNRKWYNIELTNQMFSTETYILQSGYIKSEALQNKIYMENLNRRELLSHQLTDLAQGYIHKFGYDEFVQKVINKALELYPNSISANMIKANLDTQRFEYVMRQLKINPHDNKQLQQIRHFPKAVELLNNVNGQYNLIDNLGFEHMPPEAYQKWLQDMRDEKQKQENKAISEQFKGILSKQANTLKN